MPIWARAGKCRLGAWAGKCQSRAKGVECGLGAGLVNAGYGSRPGAEHGAGGQGVRGPRAWKEVIGNNSMKC